MSEKKRLLWIDRLRGIAFFFVMVGHALAINPQLKSYIYSFHMPLFLMISGLNINIDRMYETPFLSYAYKLFKRMLVPYVWLNLFSLTVRYFTWIFITHQPFSVLNFLKGIVIANTRLENAPCPAAPTYYIVLLFLAQLLLWLIVRVAKKDYGKIGLGCAVALFFSLATLKKDFIWHLNVVPVAVLMLFFGRLIMDFYLKHKSEIESLSKLKSMAVCTALIGAGFIIWLYNGRVSIHANKYGEDFLLFLIGALSTSIAVGLISIKMPRVRLFEFVGKNTLFLLGTHSALMSIINNLFHDCFVKYPWFFLVEAVAVYLILTPACFLANRLIPWANGNPLKEKSIPVEICKFLSIAAAGFVPCNQFINRFAGGILESSTGMRIASIVGYILLCTAVYFIFNRFMKFMFIIDYPSPCSALKGRKNCAIMKNK